MKVFLGAKGFLGQYIAGKEIELEPGTRLDQLPAVLGLPEQCRLIYVVNQKIKAADSAISDGDRIIIVSTLSGG